MMEYMIRSFCSMITPGPMLRKQFRKPYKYSTVKSYLTRHICQTLLHPTTTFFDPCTVPCEEVTKWVNQWVASKEPDFFNRGIYLLSEKLENVVLFNGKYFKWNIFYFTILISALLFIKRTAKNLVVHRIFRLFPYNH